MRADLKETPWEKPIADELSETGWGGKTYLGTVQMTDYTHMVNTRVVTLWQPAPSSCAEARGLGGSAGGAGEPTTRPPCRSVFQRRYGVVQVKARVN